MTKDELIEQVRIKVDDINEPYLVSDLTFDFYFTEALLEASRRARLKIETIDVPIVAGTSRYTLPDNVIRLRRATLAGSRCKLAFTTTGALDDCHCGWDELKGTPKAIVTDTLPNELVLTPTPDKDDTLSYVAIIEPDPEADPIDIPARYHYGLLEWICYRYYGIQDADVHNIDKSEYHYQKFEKEFGEAAGADNEIFDIRTNQVDQLNGYY